MSDIFGPLYFEKVLLKLLFLRADVRNVVLPYLKPEVFTDVNVKIIVGEIVKFHNTFNKFPKAMDILLNLKTDSSQNALNELRTLNIEKFDEEHLLLKIENFFRKQLVNEELGRAVELMIKDEVSLIDTQKILEAKSFSFNTNIGFEILEDDGSEFYDYLHDQERIIPSGLKHFDQMMCGGFRRKALTMFLAGTNCGKTRLKCSFAKNVLTHNNNVLFIPLEGTKEVIRDRIFYNLLDMSRDELLKLDKGQLKDLIYKTKQFINSRMIIQEYSEHDLTANKLKLFLKNLKEKKKFVPDVIFIDYLGLVAPNVISKDGGNQSFNLKRASEEFHAIAKEYDVAMVSSMQFNRKGFGNSDPGMEDISESFATLFTADEVILLIQTDDMLKEKRQLYKKVKTRNGNKGFVGNFYIDDAKTNLYELEQGQQTEEEKKKQSLLIESETENIKKELLKSNESLFTKNFEFT